MQSVSRTHISLQPNLSPAPEKDSFAGILSRNMADCGLEAVPCMRV